MQVPISNVHDLFTTPLYQSVYCPHSSTFPPMSYICHIHPITWRIHTLREPLRLVVLFHIAEHHRRHWSVQLVLDNVVYGNTKPNMFGKICNTLNLLIGKCVYPMFSYANHVIPINVFGETAVRYSNWVIINLFTVLKSDTADKRDW